MLFLLGSCATPLVCWHQRPQSASSAASLTTDQSLLLQIDRSANVTQLEHVALALHEESSPYVLYRYHQKRALLEEDARLKAAFGAYAAELEQLHYDDLTCTEAHDG